MKLITAAIVLCTIGSARQIHRMYPNKIAKDFWLFLSDQDAGGTDLHSVLHNGIWETLMPATMDGLSDHSFDKYISETVANAKVPC